MNTKNIPCQAYLFKYPSMIVKQAAQDIFAKYQLTPGRQENIEYLSFSGEAINSIILRRTTIIFWVEEQGEEKSILYLTAIKVDGGDYVPAVLYATNIQKIKADFEAIQMECVELSSQLFLAEQYQKIFKIKGELQGLYDDLQRLETYTPNATTQINKTKSAIRIKKSQLDEENNVLERLKNKDY